jgi:hypothetical protein
MLHAPLFSRYPFWQRVQAEPEDWRQLGMVIDWAGAHVPEERVKPV